MHKQCGYWIMMLQGTSKVKLPFNVPGSYKLLHTTH